MNPDRFVKVFDVVDSGFKDWTFSAFGLIFVAIGIAFAFFPALIKATGIPFLDVQSKFQRVLRFAFPLFAILWTVITFSMTYSQHLRHKSLAQGNGCRVVEGPVEQFVPMPYGGHAVESFSVSGISFRYSDFIVTDGFNNTASHGGPIRSDSYVRICYDPTGNVILRLEIRDFRGEPKDYGRNIFRLFPKAEGLQKIGNSGPAIQPPWYSSLFVLMYFLDLVAIQRLFLPYLRTFFRIKSMSNWDRAVPTPLEAGVKIKFRNSMIYWDKEDHAIWLRPRGFNLIQIPLTVARLNVSADNGSICGYEIRLSSGAPILLALFAWAAFLVFSAGPAAGRPPAAVFVVFLGVFIVIAGWMNLRIFRSRMEKLIEDAVSELGGI
jgi:tryptophan-rich sensory protein